MWYSGVTILASARVCESVIKKARNVSCVNPEWLLIHSCIGSHEKHDSTSVNRVCVAKGYGLFELRPKSYF